MEEIVHTESQTRTRVGGKASYCMIAILVGCVPRPQTFYLRYNIPTMSPIAYRPAQIVSPASRCHIAAVIAHMLSGLRHSNQELNLECVMGTALHHREGVAARWCLPQMQRTMQTRADTGQGTEQSEVMTRTRRSGHNPSIDCGSGFDVEAACSGLLCVYFDKADSLWKDQMTRMTRSAVYGRMITVLDGVDPYHIPYRSPL